MNIAIVNAWSDDNKGDAAIVEGMIRSLTDGSAEALHFDLLSMFRALEGSRAHYRHTLGLPADISVYPSLLPVDRPPQGSSPVRLLEFVRAVLVLILGRLGRWLLPAPEREALAALGRADLVISKGGHIYFSRGGFRSILGLFRNLFPIMLAQRLGRPTAVYGQSVGPVRGRLQRGMVRKVLGQLDALYVREPISLEATRRLGVSGAGLSWDTAFAVTGEPLPTGVREAIETPFAALTVRQWGFPYSDRDPEGQYRDYLSSIVHCIRRFEEEYDVPVVVAPQAIGPTPMENDLTASRDLRTLLAEGPSGPASTVFLDADLTAGQLLTLYEQADLILSTRFHSAILAIAAGTPPVAISYHGPKADGIMRMMGLEEYTISIGELKPPSLWSLCQGAWESRRQTAEAIRRRLPDVRDSIEASTRDILRLGR